MNGHSCLIRIHLEHLGTFWYLAKGKKEILWWSSKVNREPQLTSLMKHNKLKDYQWKE